MKLAVVLLFVAAVVHALPADNDDWVETATASTQAVTAFAAMEGPTVEALQDLKAKEGDASCESMANTTIEEVKKSYNETAKIVSDSALSAIKVCEDTEKKIIKTYHTEMLRTEMLMTTKKTSYEKLVETKKTQLTIDLTSYTFEEMNKDQCGNEGFTISSLFETNSWETAWREVKLAKGEYQTASLTYKAAKTRYMNAKTDTTRHHQCMCSVKNSFIISHHKQSAEMVKTHQSAWEKAYHLLCVLASNTYEKCAVPPLPTLVPPKITVTKEACDGLIHIDPVPVVPKPMPDPMPYPMPKPMPDPVDPVPVVPKPRPDPMPYPEPKPMPDPMPEPKPITDPVYYQPGFEDVPPPGFKDVPRPSPPVQPANTEGPLQPSPVQPSDRMVMGGR